MEGKSQGVASMICGIGSLVSFLLLFLIENEGFGLFIALLGLAAGIVAICLAVAAKKSGYKETMQKAGFVLGVVGTSIMGIVFLLYISQL